MPTRRTIVVTGGVVGLSGIAGCVGTPESPTEEENSSTEGSDNERATELAGDAELKATLSVSDEAEQTLFTTADIAAVGAVTTNPQTGPSVPIELTAAGVESVTKTADGVDLDETYEQATITVTLDGEQVNQFGINADLAAAIAGGEWAGEFVLVFADEVEATAFRDRLLAEA